MPPSPMHPAVPMAVPRCPWQVSHSFTSSRSPPLQQSEVTFRKPVLPEEPPKAKAVGTMFLCPKHEGGFATNRQAFCRRGCGAGQWIWTDPQRQVPSTGGPGGGVGGRFWEGEMLKACKLTKLLTKDSCNSSTKAL